MLIGFLHRGGLEQWSYAIMADIAVQGVEVMRFTSADVDFDKRLILGEIWQDGRWVKQWFRYPDAVRNFEFRDNEKDTLLEFVPYSLGRHLRKDEQLALLGKMPGLGRFIPVTQEFDDQVDLLQLLQNWPGVILKPARGRLGQGIFFIRRLGPDYQLEEAGQRRTLDQQALRDFIDGFMQRTARSYVVQQFAASTGPQGRYFNVRIIVQKSGDGDWHPCAFPLSLLARSGSVVANREAGATNVLLKTILKQRFGIRAEHVLNALFAAAVLIARALDDALAQRADELALDLAVDEKGAPWLHETNWRGGFWMLQEDVGLYRFGGANAVRMACQNRFGVDTDVANAALLLAKMRPVDAGQRPAPEPNLKAMPQLGIDIVLRFDALTTSVVRALTGGVNWVAVSDAASFGAAQRVLGRAYELMHEQAPTRNPPKTVSMAGYCQHDPFDERSPRRWIEQELVATGIITADEARLGASLSPAFLRRMTEQNRRDLGLDTLDIFLIEAIEQHIAQNANWPARWREAAVEMTKIQAGGGLREWGFCISYTWLIEYPNTINDLMMHAGAVGAEPQWVLVAMSAADSEQISSGLPDLLSRLPLKVMIRVLPLAPCIKPWDQSHRLLPVPFINALVKAVAGIDVVIFCPVGTAAELEDFFAIDRFLPDGKFDMVTHETLTATEVIDPVARALQTLARFDQRQLFRFFVDGRFHKKYRGWVGYENNEAGSVQGILDGYSLVMDNFDLSDGLTSSYIRNLHIACMSGVTTKNKKSTPGEMRSLESGLNLYHGKSTLASVQELLDQRRTDGSIIFHHPEYQRRAEEFTAEEILEIIKKEGRIRYRAWYPELSAEQQRQLTQPKNLRDYYAVKHFVQMCFAERTDHIVDSYNQAAAAASTADQHLMAISRVVRDLELLHPFPDGNGRTFVAVLMNHLLLWRGWLPAILWDPNIDAELSVSEFADEIRLGILNTETLLRDPTTRLYDFSITEARPEEIKTFQRMSHGFVSRMQSRAYGLAQDAPVSDEPQVYLTLTPGRLTAATGGVWIQENPALLSTLRFAQVSLGGANGSQQLLFCRNLKTWKENGKDPLAELQHEIHAGVVAVVLDDAELAQHLNVPALVVADVDDALYETGISIRKITSCKAIAVVGTDAAAQTRELLTQASRSQLRVYVDPAGECKTPQVMASLANLRRTDQLVIVEVATGARVNVARHRLRAIEPDFCLFSSSDNVDRLPKEGYTEVLKTLAACVDGLRPGGLCILNSATDSFARLKQEILTRRPVAIQTFGNDPNDDGRLLDASFDERSKTWQVDAEIIGKPVHYKVRGVNAPLLSVGVLLALENLGCQIENVFI